MLLADNNKAELAESLLEGAPRRRQGTALATAAALFKAVVGTGIFALPPAIRASGIFLGSAVALLMGLISWYTTWAMLEAVRELRRRGHNSHHDGRIEYTEVTALYSPQWDSAVTFLCVLGQMGSALGFFAFICDSVQPLLGEYGLARAHVFALTAALEIPLVLLRDTSHPAFEAAMTFGNVAVALALGTVLWGTLIAPSAEFQRPAPSELVYCDTDGIGLLFGVTLIMFSCHLEAVSIEADMARREHFDTVMNAVFVVLGVVFLGFGLVVYSALGEATGRVYANAGFNRSDASEWVEATILQNLEDGVFVVAVKCLMSLNLVLTMPITLVPALRALEQMSRASTAMSCAALRIATVLALAVGAAVFPGFEAIVGVTGALGGATCFTLPALCYDFFCAARLAPWQRGLAYAVAAFGIAGTVWSFYQQLV